jgi:hypothetical protein
MLPLAAIVAALSSATLAGADTTPPVATPAVRPGGLHLAAGITRPAPSPQGTRPAPLDAATLASAKHQVASAFHPAAATSMLLNPMELDPGHLQAQSGWQHGELLLFDAGLVDHGVYMPLQRDGMFVLEYSLLPAPAAYLVDCTILAPVATSLTVTADWMAGNSTTPAFQSSATLPIFAGHFLYGFPGVAGTSQVDLYVSVPQAARTEDVIQLFGCALHSVP